MKSTTFAIVFILLTNLFITESFVIKGDLTYNNKENDNILPIVLNDDVNNIEKRQVGRRQRIIRRRRRQRRQQILNLQSSVNALRTQLSNLEVAISSRLRTVQTMG